MLAAVYGVNHKKIYSRNIPLEMGGACVDPGLGLVEQHVWLGKVCAGCQRLHVAGEHDVLLHQGESGAGRRCRLQLFSSGCDVGERGGGHLGDPLRPVGVRPPPGRAAVRPRPASLGHHPRGRPAQRQQRAGRRPLDHLLGSWIHCIGYVRHGYQYIVINVTNLQKSRRARAV